MLALLLNLHINLRDGSVDGNEMTRSVRQCCCPFLRAPMSVCSSPEYRTANSERPPLASVPAVPTPALSAQRVLLWNIAPRACPLCVLTAVLFARRVNGTPRCVTFLSEVPAVSPSVASDCAALQRTHVCES